MHPTLSVCTFLRADTLDYDVAKSLDAALPGKSNSGRYTIASYSTVAAFCQFVEQEKHRLDCLILQDLQDDRTFTEIVTWLHGQAVLLPAVVLTDSLAPAVLPDNAASGVAIAPSFRYHTAEVTVDAANLEQIERYIEQAIAQFITLSPTCWSKTDAIALDKLKVYSEYSLITQQRLAEKLKERLGYLGVYSKRNAQNFYRYLAAEAKQELLEKLKLSYRDIVLCYFGSDGTLNQRIDTYVNTIFFADVSAAQVVEIHMDLMDEFSKQLKLEGRSEEVLLDYRLTLIDTIAHLCEMYRRSLSKEP